MKWSTSPLVTVGVAVKVLPTCVLVSLPPVVFVSFVDVIATVKSTAAASSAKAKVGSVEISITAEISIDKNLFIFFSPFYILIIFPRF